MRRATTRVLIIVAVMLTAMLGLVGLLISAEVALIVLPSPATVRQQAWRVLALTALTTGLLAGVVGGAYLGISALVDGTDTPLQSLFAFLEGGIIFGVPGLIVGVTVGSVLAYRYRRQRGRPIDEEALDSRTI